MSRQRDREEFVALMTKEGVPLTVAHALMRAATTLHRLAESECNGDDWRTGNLVPCPEAPPGSFNRHGVFIGPATTAWCPTCGLKTEHGRVSASSIKDARVTRRVEQLCAAHGLVPVFSGDPRGAVLKLKVPSGHTNDWGQTGVCVP